MIPSDLAARLVPSTHFQGLGRVLAPEPEAALAEEILVVQEQLFQAGPSDSCGLQLALPGGGGGHASFRDVLYPAARGLNHLIVSAGALVHKPIAEDHGGIVNHLCRLEAAQLAAATVRQDNAWMTGLT